MGRLFKTAEIGFATAQRIEDLVRYAQLAEQNGFTSFWLGERYYARGIYTAAAAVAVATKKIKIGLGIVSPFTRHPSMIAMETAALDELSEGRVMLGLGVSQISAQRQGVADTKPVTSLKETIAILRGFFAGDRVVYDGLMFQMNEPGTSFVFEPYRADIPIHIGGMGPKSLELAGRLAAGQILVMFATPGFT
ncbi:MAG: LLM class flavin-dependent oxidoreductase, partial [Proteobacteria bacterium]|nr:LLM class flavin-dependent oxidoreductase [Pseudomonadota bacterium]